MSMTSTKSQVDFVAPPVFGIVFWLFQILERTWFVLKKVSEDKNPCPEKLNSSLSQMQYKG